MSIQSAASLTATNWQNLATTYIWINDSFTCFTICDNGGIVRENIINTTPSFGMITNNVSIGSYEYVIKHSWNPNGPTFYRMWSGLPATP
jgi:hypothetical protein